MRALALPVRAGWVFEFGGMKASYNSLEVSGEIIATRERIVMGVSERLTATEMVIITVFEVTSFRRGLVWEQKFLDLIWRHACERILLRVEEWESA